MSLALASAAYSPDQAAALSALDDALRHRRRVSVLTGPAGSGKTTLMRRVATIAAAQGRDVLYAAPTGKAALRLSQVTGEDATTLHSLLYGQVEEDENGEPVFSGKKRLMSRRTLLIVDEASMGERYHRGTATIDDVADWMVKRTRAGSDSVVLSWTHKVRARVNDLVRNKLGHSGPLVAGDRVRVMLNNKDLGRMNGEILTVKMVMPSGRHLVAVFVDDAGRTTKAHVNPDLLGAKVGRFREFAKHNLGAWLHIDHGYALTVHASQGSEFEHVAFVIDPTTTFLARKDPANARRLVYTAVTRARESLVVFDVGRP